MANLMTANLPSEDEEDQDYVPDEVDEEERRAAKEKKRPKRLRGAAAGAGAASANSDEEDAGGSGAGGDELEDHDAALPASKREAKRAKVDALWSQLNAAKPAARPAAGASLAALCKPAAAKKGGGDEVRSPVVKRCSHCVWNGIGFDGWWPRRAAVLVPGESCTRSPLNTPHSPPPPCRRGCGS